MFFTSKKAHSYMDDFIKKNDFSDWLSYFSIYVWKRLELLSDNYNTIAKCSETTLTENLVHGILLLMKEDEIPIPVRLFHSPKEKTYGSDIEIVVQLAKDRNIIFACQAKKLNVEGYKKLNARYNAFNHDGGEQKEKLINYAEAVNGFPLYLLYNYSEYEFQNEYKDDELYGCSLISAIHLKENPLKDEKPKFQDLHPISRPLKTIIKIENIDNLKYFYGLSNNHFAKILTDKEIFGDKEWKDNELGSPIYHRTESVFDARKLAKPTSANYEEIEDIGQINNSSHDLRFSPKFRIVLTHDIIDLNTRNTKSFKL
jgi:hypothetical protein